MNPASYRWPDIPRTIGLAVLYALMAEVALRFFSNNGVVTLLWPPSGLALAALLIGGRKYWPGVFIGALAGNMMAGSSAEVSFFIACGNTLEAIAAAWLLSRTKGFVVALTHPRDYLWLGIAASASAPIGALAGSGTLFLSGLLSGSMFLPNLLYWWQGDVLGMLLITPLILVWRQLPEDWSHHRRRLLEASACFGLAFLFGQAIFLGWFHDLIGPIARGYWMFLFAAWGAVRFGRHGALLIISTAAIQAPFGSALGVGIFGAGSSQINIHNLWFYMLILSTVGITLALSIHARNKAEQREHIRTRLLELIAKDVPLQDILQTIVRNVEEHHPHMLCSILLLDQESKHLLTGAAPSLPDFYNKAVHDLEIGMGVGSCGTAAFTGERVIVEDIQTHPYWAGYKELAASAGLGSCWSDPVKNASGKVLGTFAIYHRKASTPTADDIQLIEQTASLAGIAIEKQMASDSLQASSQHLRTIIETTPECVKLVDTHGTLLSMNAAGLRMIEADDEKSVIGQNVYPIIDPEYREDFRLFNERICQGQKGSLEFAITGLKGTRRWMETHAVPFVDKTNGQVVQLAVTRDITQKKESEYLIWQQANFDALTGLPNRHMFHDRLQQAMKKAHRSGLPMALMFLDLDRFKEINDTLGHDMGDILLKEAAQRLNNCVRETDVVSRLGGDEFTVIISDLSDSSNVDHIAQNILRKLAEPFDLKNEYAYVSASIGITLYPEDAATIEDLLKNADQAMYLAKNTSGNRFCYFTKSMQEAAQNRMRMTNDLRAALLDKTQFRVYYQPIVELATGNIHKAEALIRWQHPALGLVSPAEFIPIAEDTGMIVEIGNWVFNQAAQQVARWRANYAADFQISINKSPVQIYSAVKNHDSWCGRLKELDLPGQSIVVEITEGLLLEGNDTVNQHLLEFRDAGIQVALDDFGTGYSSLSYIKKFHIDYLKIDQSFIRTLRAGSDDMALCEAIVVMAHKLDMKVVAEGVETVEQRDLLLSMGCDYAQGFLFSKPVPADEFEKILNSSRKIVAVHPSGRSARATAR